MDKIQQAKLTLVNDALAKAEAEQLTGRLYHGVKRAEYCRNRANHWLEREKEELAAETKATGARAKKIARLKAQRKALQAA